MPPLKPNKPSPEQAASVKQRVVAPMTLVMRDNADKVFAPKEYFNLKICSEQAARPQVICDQTREVGKEQPPKTEKVARKGRLKLNDISQIRM